LDEIKLLSSKVDGLEHNMNELRKEVNSHYDGILKLLESTLESKCKSEAKTLSFFSGTLGFMIKIISVLALSAWGVENILGIICKL